MVMVRGEAKVSFDQPRADKQGYKEADTYEIKD
jgi:hypothetical protein